MPYTPYPQLSHLEGEDSERLICATCVVRLRQARAFRQQVLQCEEKLLHANIQVHEGIYQQGIGSPPITWDFNSSGKQG